MEDNLKQIASFVTSDYCIYEMQAIDYPTFPQQQFINSFFTLRNIMDNDHPIITKNLYSYSQKSIDTIGQGFIYWLMVQPHQLDRLLGHLTVLKVEVWENICSNLQKLLKDPQSNIKTKFKSSFALILQQLALYRSLSFELCKLLIKSISNYQFGQHHLLASKSLLEAFFNIINQKDVPKPLLDVSCHFLFIKCLKILSMRVKQLEHICQQIVFLLFHKNSSQCVRASTEILTILNELAPNDTKLVNLIQPQIQIINVDDNEDIRSILLSVLLPLKIQNSLIFLFNQNNDKNAIKYHLNWLYQSSIQPHQYPIKIKLIGDIARWVILQAHNLQIRMHVLLWLVKISLNLGQNEAYFRIRWLIFLDWSYLPFSYLFCSLSFLRHLLYYDVKIAEDFLKYLVQLPIEGQKMKAILWEAHEKKILRLQLITENQIIIKAIKDEIIKIMGNSEENSVRAMDFDPDQYIEQNEEEINYDEPLAIQLSQSENQIDTDYSLNLEQNFVHEIGDELIVVLETPNIENYTMFLGKVWKVCLSNIKYKNTVESLTEETAKVTYILFNHEFEDLKSEGRLEESVLHFLLKYVSEEWKRVTNKLEITKKIVKKLIDMFPVAEVAFWRHFLSNFKFGGANYRDVKSWLIPKNKVNQVVWMIEEMTEKVEGNIRTNAAAYGIKAK